MQLMHTVERLTEAVDPGERVYPPASVLERSSPRQHEPEIYRDLASLKPSQVRQFRQTDHRKREREGVEPQIQVCTMITCNEMTVY